MLPSLRSKYIIKTMLPSLNNKEVYINKQVLNKFIYMTKEKMAN